LWYQLLSDGSNSAVQSDRTSLAVWTIGHSTRPIDEFLALLRAHRIVRLADVRTVPRSSRHPPFASDQLAAHLAGAGLTYLHIPKLGGLRHPRRNSTNLAWQNASFRGYADYMETTAFEDGLRELEQFAVERTAVMCAEAVWWRCHRQLIADALVARGWEVRHILSVATAEPHHLTSFAVVEGEQVRYPGLLG
jgi:uncharacterized protein (DUF488 family)